jgi:peptidoglycan/LPS O-acetylase OafA/YrhL
LGLAFLANVTSPSASRTWAILTLAVEEQFYLFLPAAVWRLSRRVSPGFASAVVVLTPLARGVAFHYGQTDGLAEYTWFVLAGLRAARYWRCCCARGSHGAACGGSR